jgi:hypothetical protein
MELDRAMAISRTAQVIVNSAKIEVDYLKTVSEVYGQTLEARNNSKFFGYVQEPLALPASAEAKKVKPNSHTT